MGAWASGGADAAGGWRTGSAAGRLLTRSPPSRPPKQGHFYAINQNCKLSLSSLLHQPSIWRRLSLFSPLREED